MLYERTFGDKVVKVEPYSALPCELMIFTINDIDADRTDFGITTDNDMWNAPDYGCGDKRFERYTEKDDIKNCMETYSLTWEEYLDIVSLLEEVLCVGECSWCV
jgi:hypothetical protein